MLKDHLEKTHLEKQLEYIDLQFDAQIAELEQMREKAKGQVKTLAIKRGTSHLTQFIGDPPEMVEAVFEKYDGCCFVCGQPFNKAPQIKELKTFIKKEIIKALDEVVVSCCVEDKNKDGYTCACCDVVLEKIQTIKENLWY